MNAADAGSTAGVEPLVLSVAALLAFEAAHTAHTGAKETAIHDELRLDPARYYQLLHRAIDTAEALRLDPTLTNRLRRIRDRAAKTTAARLGHERSTP